MCRCLIVMVSFGGFTRSEWKQRRRARELAGTRRAAVHARRQVRAEQFAWLQKAWRLVAVAAVFCSGAVAIAVFVLPAWLYPYVVGAELVSLVWWLHFIMIETSGLMGRVSGISAEWSTVDELRGLRCKGWRLINHVMLEYVDVDHVLIGPGGLYALETKHRSNWRFARTEFPQIARSATAAARDPRLRPHQRASSATAVVVMWGPHLRRDFDQPFEVDGVTFCPGHRLVEHLLAQPIQMPSDEVDEAFAKLDHYVRSRDIGEIREHGPVPRLTSDVANDVVATAFVVIVATILMLLPIRIEPTPIWSFGVSIIGAAGSLLARSRTRASPRCQTITAGATAVSIGIAVLLVAVIGWSHL